MGRPDRRGLDYYNIDVDFMKDLKVRKIMHACGPQSVAVLINLLGSIYQDEGYYMVWDEDVKFLISDDFSMEESDIQDIVDKALQVKFFDQKMFDKYQILSSHGIQERYKEIVKKAKRKNCEINPKYDLTVGETVSEETGVNSESTVVFPEETPVNSEETSVNSDRIPNSSEESTQSKVKESKGKNKKNSASGDDTTSFETDFDQIWKYYPNKKGKKEAFNHYKAWRKKSASNTNRYLFERLKFYTRDLEAKKSWLEPMNGSTWFNGRFDDTYDSERQEEEQTNKNWFGD